MMAIPIFRTRVAPVLDWCSKILIVPEEAPPDVNASREIGVQETGRFALMRALRQQGIDTVICGALSPEMLHYGESLGLRIIHGIAGDIEEVLQAYRKGELDRPRYWLPGCRGQRRYKGSAKCTGVTESSEPGLLNMATGGPGGLCICPQCGATAPHERGIPCSQLRCPGCSAAMTRKIDN